MLARYRKSAVVSLLSTSVQNRSLSKCLLIYLTVRPLEFRRKTLCFEVGQDGTQSRTDSETQKTQSEQRNNEEWRTTGAIKVSGDQKVRAFNVRGLFSAYSIFELFVDFLSQFNETHDICAMVTSIKVSAGPCLEDGHRNHEQKRICHYHPS